MWYGYHHQYCVKLRKKCNGLQHKFQFWLLSHKQHKKNQHISHGSLIPPRPPVIKNLEGWRGKIFLYYYYVKTLSHSWISLNSRMLQLSGQISKYHWTNFTSAGSDDVTTAYSSLFNVSSSSSSPNLIFLFSISSSSHSPPAGYRWCSRSSAGVDRSSSPRRCWRSSPPPPLPAPPSTGRSPWGEKHNLGWRTKRAKFNK